MFWKRIKRWLNGRAEREYTYIVRVYIPGEYEKIFAFYEQTDPDMTAEMLLLKYDILSVGDRQKGVLNFDGKKFPYKKAVIYCIRS